jgi:NAD(P)-dependent dehydrogenase (short-subunit alcohol dehydrogenase family)
MKKTILITGGTGKIGTQLVLHLMSKGYFVVFTGRTKLEIDLLLSKIPALVSSELGLGLVIDLEINDSGKILGKMLEDRDIWPDCLVNTVRSTEYLKVAADGITSRSNWIGEFLLGIISFYELAMELSLNKRSGLKNIINVSSMYGIVPPNPSLYENPQQESPIQYGVIKAAQIHLVKELAVRLAKLGIRVNTISYGGVEGRADPSFIERYGKLCPLGRMLKDEEVAGGIDFLISDGSIGMTGHNLIVDGGWTVW